MSEPIYLLYLVRGYREAYYQLSDEGRAQFWKRIDENITVSGETNLLTCNSRWCNEAYLAWGLGEFPDLQAVWKSAQTNEDNQHFRYLATESVLGMKMGDDPIDTVDFPDPIYQLWMVKNPGTSVLDSLPASEGDHLGSKVGESIQNHGGVSVIVCDCGWSNEEYSAFGITAWPNLAAEQAHFKDLESLGWHRYLYAKTILGTQIG